ncbi:MAG: hypothetical protein V5A79_05855 [Candidatus Bipolaricaulota bacterium]
MVTNPEVLDVARKDPSVDRESFKRGLKVLEETQLENMRVLIEMELMERDRRK